MKLKSMVWIGAILIFILFAHACVSHPKKEAIKKEEVLTLISKPLSANLFFSGIVQPLKTRVITSPADGVIQDMFIHYGDHVKAGNLLFTISSEKFQSDFKTALMQYY